jgi:hypothetical protein
MPLVRIIGEQVEFEHLHIQRQLVPLPPECGGLFFIGRLGYEHKYIYCRNHWSVITSLHFTLFLKFFLSFSCGLNQGVLFVLFCFVQVVFHCIFLHLLLDSDYIRQYTWDKRVESVVKSTMTTSGKAPTVISPIQYKDRFREAMDKYFMLVPDKFSFIESWEDSSSDQPRPIVPKADQLTDRDILDDETIKLAKQLGEIFIADEQEPPSLPPAAPTPNSVITLRPSVTMAAVGGDDVASVSAALKLTVIRPFMPLELDVKSRLALFPAP